MTIILYVLYAIQVLVAIGIIAIVVTSTSKESGLGALSGEASSSSRYKGGMEETIDRWGVQLAGSFLLVSLLVAIIERRL